MSSSPGEKDATKLNKEMVNNMVVKLRPCVKQARVHLIHQLSKTVSQLRKRKVKDEKEKEKNERKISRFVDEIRILRKEDKDVMGRWVLTNTKTFADLTKEETLSKKFDLRLRVLVRVGEHKAVGKKLEELREAYPNWGREVPKLLKSLGKAKKKIKELNSETVDAKCDVKDVSKDNKSSGNTKGVDKADTNEDSVVSVEIGENDEDRGEESESESDTDQEDSDTDSASDDDSTFVDSLKNVLSKSSDNPSNISKSLRADPESLVNKKSGSMVVKVLDLNSEKDTGNISGISSPSDQVSLETTEPVKRKISSFFMGGESESEEDVSDEMDDEAVPYGEDMIQKRQESLKMKLRDDSFTTQRGRGNFNSQQGRGRGRGGFNSQYERGHTGRGRGGYGSQDMRGNSGRGKVFNNHNSAPSYQHNLSLSEKKSEPVDPNLHPSWAAKKNNSSSIAKFEGKKIKFDSEQSITSNISIKPKPTNDMSDKSNLHPSWAAKQNQKASIQSFQGKKMVFDD